MYVSMWCGNLFHPTLREELQAMRHAIEMMSQVLRIRDVPDEENEEYFDLLFAGRNTVKLYQCRFLSEHMDAAYEIRRKAKEKLAWGHGHIVQKSEERVSNGYYNAKGMYDEIGYSA